MNMRDILEIAGMILCAAFFAGLFWLACLITP